MTYGRQWACLVSAYSPSVRGFVVETAPALNIRMQRGLGASRISEIAACVLTAQWAVVDSPFQDANCGLSSYILVKGPKSTNGGEPTGLSHPLPNLPERISYF